MRTRPWSRPFDEDHDAFRDSVRRFFADEVAPELDGWRGAVGGPLDLWVSAAKHGLLGTGIDEQYGGGGVSDPLFAAVLVEEAMAVGAVGTAWVLAAQEGVAIPLLRDHGSSEQQARWLAPVAAGESAIVPLPFGVAMSAETVSHGVRLTGDAHGVAGINGPVTFVVRFRADEGDGIAVVAADSPGVGVTHVADALGGRDATQLDVRFDGVVVGSADLIRPSPDALGA
ncbi:MAG: acyl-CoA dehydrogenase family protein, partial [Acidimicrobiaceae bacterium]|nr:acyl-CoA dehydrogenase family protein [Acidimicrobiaceae bacterium]